jgi:hypothetical protein
MCADDKKRIRFSIIVVTEKPCTANEAQYKCLVQIDVFKEMKLGSLVISKTEL